MAQKIAAYGFTWTAIQRYNGSDPKLGYAQKVFAIIQQQHPEIINNNQIVFNIQPSPTTKLPDIVINPDNNPNQDISADQTQPQTKFFVSKSTTTPTPTPSPAATPKFLYKSINN